MLTLYDRRTNYPKNLAILGVGLYGFELKRFMNRANQALDYSHGLFVTGLSSVALSMYIYTDDKGLGDLVALAFHCLASS